MNKRPEKIKMEVVPIPAGANFKESIRRCNSIYVTKLQEAANASQAVVIDSEDKYLLSQFKIAAKKMFLKIVFAQIGKDMFIKPIVTDGEVKRLMLWLREPRSLNELMSKKFELHLNNTLSKLAGDGVAHFHKEKWVLTAKGLEQI